MDVLLRFRRSAGRLGCADNKRNLFYMYDEIHAHPSEWSPVVESASFRIQSSKHQE